MNIAISIKAKLLNLAKLENINYQTILIRFFHERFLLRLAQSKYPLNLILKGGNFVYAMHGNKARPTTDIDLAGANISSSEKKILSIVKEIAEIKIDDGVIFNTSEITTMPIAEQNQYHGVRIKFEAKLDSIKQNIQIDVGFGDKITPRPIQIKYPILLQDMAHPIIMSYNIETTIAEKLHAIYLLGDFNSRLKDYYDIFAFINHPDFNNSNLYEAIQSTFQNRKTKLDTEQLLTVIENFADNKQSHVLWKAFLRKSNLEDISFHEVAEIIIAEIKKL